MAASASQPPRCPRSAAVHYNYGRAAPRRLVDRSPQEPQRHGDGHDRAAVEAVSDDALSSEPPARARATRRPRRAPAELVLQSCALRALARAGPSEAEEHARVRRAHPAPYAVAFASKTNRFALCVDISAAVFVEVAPRVRCF